MITLSSTTPMPVSSTAIFASGMRALLAAMAAAKKDFVHLLLGIGCKFLLGFAHFLHALLQRLHGIDDRIFSGWRGNV